MLYDGARLFVGGGATIGRTISEREVSPSPATGTVTRRCGSSGEGVDVFRMGQANASGSFGMGNGWISCARCGEWGSGLPACSERDVG